MKLEEVGLRDHHGVSTVAVVCGILELLRENVAGVDSASNVENLDVAVDDGLEDFAFTEVDVFHPLVGK